MSSMSTSSDQTSFYPGPDIDIGLNSIRLFTFTRDNAGNILGHLEAHNTDDQDSCPKWIALSYTWDTYHFKAAYPDRIFVRTINIQEYTISLNGQPFTIGANLWHALQALLDEQQALPRTVDHGLTIDPFLFDGSIEPSSWRYFWIDALCINQNNAKERDHQVCLMRFIYSRAEFVIAWLAPENPSATYQEMSSSLSSLVRQWVPELAKSREARDNVNWKAYAELRSVIGNAYWTRVWIVQELILAKKFVCLCGPVWINQHFWSAFEKTRIAPCSSLRSILGHRRTSEFSLESLLHSYQGQESTDQRDRIYGLLGLLPACQIRPNYEISLADLFLRVVHELIFDRALSFNIRDDVDLAASALQLGPDYDLLTTATAAFYETQYRLGLSRAAGAYSEKKIYNWLAVTEVGRVTMNSSNWNEEQIRRAIELSSSSHRQT